MAILPRPSASVRPVSAQILTSLINATQVVGEIEITSITPASGETPASLTLDGQGEGYFVSNNNGVATIFLKPTSAQSYPVVYTLTLVPPDGFSFLLPLGQLSLPGQNDGFLLSSPTLQMYIDDQNLVQEFNLALQFFDQSTNQLVQVGDPTIVFEPPS